MMDVFIAGQPSESCQFFGGDAKKILQALG